MKKLVLLLAVVFSASLFSCGGAKDGGTDSDSISANIDSTANAVIDSAAATIDSTAVDSTQVAE